MLKFDRSVRCCAIISWWCTAYLAQFEVDEGEHTVEVMVKSIAKATIEETTMNEREEHEEQRTAES